MSDPGAPVVLRLAIGDEQTPVTLTEQATADMYEELSQVPGISVSRAASESAPGTKSGTALQAGELLVSFVSGGGVTGLVAAVKLWTSRDKGRSAELHLASGESIKVSGTSREQVERMINSFLGSQNASDKS
jgi:hypothetical protein